MVDGLAVGCSDWLSPFLITLNILILCLVVDFDVGVSFKSKVLRDLYEVMRVVVAGVLKASRHPSANETVSHGCCNAPSTAVRVLEQYT